ncbi:MAG TPA: nitrilase-related carbon-nitrogen hydrolase [Caulobacter sp.]|nr:nitrilase-related carbon-nitrogen hydrolase [Caulobacter sp.]
MRPTCRAALVQLCTPDTGTAALDHAMPFVQAAAAGGGELILLPETCNLMERDQVALGRKVVGEADDPFIAGLRDFAAARHVWILLGSAVVRRPDGLRANRSLLIGPAGEIVARYDKIHLFDADLVNGQSYRESANYEAGTEAVVAETPWGGLGLTICYDIRFPVLHRDLALAGAALIAVPAAFNRQTGAAHWEILLRARAIETGCFILAPAQGGNHADGEATWGRSTIVAPWGEILAAEAGDQPGLVFADLDLAAVAAARAAIPALVNRRAYTPPRAIHR